MYRCFIIKWYHKLNKKTCYKNTNVVMKMNKHTKEVYEVSREQLCIDLCLRGQVHRHPRRASGRRLRSSSPLAGYSEPRCTQRLAQVVRGPDLVYPRIPRMHSGEGERTKSVLFVLDLYALGLLQRLVIKQPHHVWVRITCGNDVLTVMRLVCLKQRKESRYLVRRRPCVL